MTGTNRINIPRTERDQVLEAKRLENSYNLGECDPPQLDLFKAFQLVYGPESSTLFSVKVLSPLSQTKPLHQLECFSG
jgi:hypothetical protein